MYNKLKNNLDRARRRKTVRKRAAKNYPKHLQDAMTIADEIRLAKEHFAKEA